MKVRLLSIILLCVVANGFAVTTEWKSNPYGQVRLIASHRVAPEQGTMTLGVEFKTIPGWHVYWKDPGDAGFAPKFTWVGSQGLEKTNVLWPLPTVYKLPGNLKAIGYEGDVVYPISADVHAVNGKIHIAADVNYLTCGTAELCIPFHYTFVLDIPAGNSPQIDADTNLLLEHFKSLVPAVDPSIDQIPVVGSADLPNSSSISVWLAIILGFIGGLILNVMPCVLPVLSIKLLGFFQQDIEHHPMRIRSGALAGAAGIITSFLGLAVVAIIAKKAGHAVGWGIQFQEPVFVAFLGLILFMFALNLWGIFEIGLPKIFGQFATSIEYQETLSAHFVSGLFVTLLATPCSAPFLGTAMGFALAQPARTILLIFTATGAGMAFPYFTLAAFPASVEWLPKPGGWMVQVRYFMGFLLMLTLVWLEFVLSRQIHITGLMLFNFLLLGLGSVSWLKEMMLIRHHGESTRGTQLLGLTLVAIFIFSLGVVHRTRLERAGGLSPEEASLGHIQWVTFDKARVASLVQAGTPVFVDVTADWCFTCKYNERFVLNDPRVVNAFENRQAVMMRADWTNRDETIGNFMKGFNRYGIPFYVLYEKGKEPMLLSELLSVSQVLKALETGK